MKLFSRYSRITLLANLAIFLVACVAFYFTLRFVLIRQIDEDLKIEEDEVRAHVQKHNSLPESFSFSDQIIRFRKAAAMPVRTLTAVELEDDGGREHETFRRLTFGIRISDQAYAVDVYKSLEESENLQRSILLVSVSTVLLILLASAIINRVLLRRLWRPFYLSLQAVRNFRVSRDQNLDLPPTRVEEFTLLNQTLKRITENSRREYLALKTFSENASHEIQTPIAIIRSKLDLLIQDEQLSRTQGPALQSAYASIEKLSRLNGSLLLLARIENRQFEEKTQFDLKQKLQQKLADFQELWQAQNIRVDPVLENLILEANPELMEILLNNLLSNATNHNYAGGFIAIRLDQEMLCIRNTSREDALEPERIFQRFYKPVGGTVNTGLGLSIIKQIVEASGWTLHYTHSDLHAFSIRWKEKADSSDLQEKIQVT